MKVKLGKRAVLPFFDTQNVMPGGGGLEAFTVTVTDPDGTDIATEDMTAAVDVPNLYTSAPILFSKVGKYTRTYKYGDDPSVILQDYVDVGPDPVSDLKRGVPQTLILDQRDAGGIGETVTVKIVDQNRALVLDETAAAYSADASGYTASTTLSKEGQYFIVWFKQNNLNQQQPFMYEHALVLTPSGAELCSFVVATLEGNNGNPHINTTVVASLSDGTKVAQGLTDNEGNLSFNLNPGAHVISLNKAGTVFSTNNFEISVINTREAAKDPSLYAASGTEIQAFQLVTKTFSPTFTAPVSPAPMCKLYADVFRMNGKPLAHATVQVGLLHKAQLFSGTAVFDTQTQFKMDANGHVEFELVQGIQVEIIIAPLSIRRVITVPSGADAMDLVSGELIPINLLDLMAGADDVFDIIKAKAPSAPRRTL
tara:strand:+ start:89801 stop:91075 length:1275 start_codon:yes stop_codon:yes gene_type:complete